MVADARDGLDISGVLGVRFELLTEPSDEDAQVFLLRGIFVSPDGLQKHGMRQDFIGIDRQLLQQ